METFTSDGKRYVYPNASVPYIPWCYWNSFLSVYKFFFFFTEPGYVATPICAVQAAYVLLKERDKLPNR